MHDLINSGTDKVNMVMMKLIILEFKITLPGAEENVCIFKLFMCRQMLTHDLKPLYEHTIVFPERSQK